MNQGYINHVGIVIDASGSMDQFRSIVPQVVDNTIEHLAVVSKNNDQETRATLYLFNNRNNIQCIYYDKDVLRLPKLTGYNPTGGTALIDATIKAIRDLQQTATLYGDHSFLLYVITDGEENNSSSSGANLKRLLDGLPDNWTVPIFVPNQIGSHHAKQFGFPVGNIEVWDPNNKSFTEIGQNIKAATDQFMANRAKGIRGTKNVFAISTSNITTTNLIRVLNYQMLTVDPADDTMISKFVENKTGKPYLKGTCYYELVKPEKIQAGKQICIFDGTDVYTDTNARSLLGIPAGEIKISPEDNPKYTVFVQSTSMNRKLVIGERLLVL